MKIKKIKCECGNETFSFEQRYECSECEFNGAWNGDTGYGYIYDGKTIKAKKLERNQSAENQECCMGENWDNGCWMYTCSKCGKKEIIATCSI